MTPPPTQSPTSTDFSSNGTTSSPTHLVPRAQRNVSWFQTKHMRQVSRLRAQGERINLMTAENWVVRDDLVELYKDIFKRDLATRHLSYADGLGGDPELLRAAAGFFNRFLKAKVPVLPEHIVSGAGVSSLLENVLYDVCDQGEGVLIETPYWGGFDTSFVLRTNVQEVHVRTPLLKADMPIERLVEGYIAAYESSLREAKYTVRAILLCNPHNPLGSIYPVEILQALLQFAERHNLFFISDEIYALSTLTTTTPFVSVLSLDLDDLGVSPSRVCTLYSISKDLGSSGLRLGFSITQANPILRLSQSITNHSRVSTFTSLVLTSLLSSPDTLTHLLSSNRDSLIASAALITDFLRFHSIPFVEPDAGVYIWAKLGRNATSWQEEDAVNDRLDEAGISVAAGRGYFASEPGWFRVTFAVPWWVLVEGLRRLERGLGLMGWVWVWDESEEEVEKEKEKKEKTSLLPSQSQ
ncbi:aminotransferase gliI [Aspergillus stella-maris]|uniref:aminotransferase gliI n=1 Tax=Aspergillus stella-maris TaxID=1810926 RepID=UPI003CCCD29F